jgi:hypothetical protein
MTRYLGLFYIPCSTLSLSDPDSSFDRGPCLILPPMITSPLEPESSPHKNLCVSGAFYRVVISAAYPDGVGSSIVGGCRRHSEYCKNVGIRREFRAPSCGRTTRSDVRTSMMVSAKTSPDEDTALHVGQEQRIKHVRIMSS